MWSADDRRCRGKRRDGDNQSSRGTHHFRSSRYPPTVCRGLASPRSWSCLPESADAARRSGDVRIIAADRRAHRAVPRRNRRICPNPRLGRERRANFTLSTLQMNGCRTKSIKLKFCGLSMSRLFLVSIRRASLLRVVSNHARRASRMSFLTPSGRPRLRRRETQWRVRHPPTFPSASSSCASMVLRRGTTARASPPPREPKATWSVARISPRIPSPVARSTSCATRRLPRSTSASTSHTRPSLPARPCRPCRNFGRTRTVDTDGTKGTRGAVSCSRERSRTSRQGRRR